MQLAADAEAAAGALSGGGGGASDGGVGGGGGATTQLWASSSSSTTGVAPLGRPWALMQDPGGGRTPGKSDPGQGCCCCCTAPTQGTPTPSTRLSVPTDVEYRPPPALTTTVMSSRAMEILPKKRQADQKWSSGPVGRAGAPRCERSNTLSE